MIIPHSTWRGRKQLRQALSWCPDFSEGCGKAFVVIRSLPASDARRPHFTDWLLRVSVAGLFIAIGWEKFASGHSGQEWVQLFARLGLGQWFRYFTGIVEALGGALMLVPRATLAGAGLLACAMAGAITAHLFVLGDPFSSIIPAVLLGIVVAITFKLRAETGETKHISNSRSCRPIGPAVQALSCSIPLPQPHPLPSLPECTANTCY